jgi:predicted RNase H-like nuclease (RuvC/YqgF family)
VKKVLISLAAAASTVAIAAPASAQWYPQPQGYAYGYNNMGHVRALQNRIDRLQFDIRNLAQRRMISPYEYQNLRAEARDIERRLRFDVRDGGRFDQREAYNTARRIQRLEYRIQRDARDRNWRRSW